MCWAVSCVIAVWRIIVFLYAGMGVDLMKVIQNSTILFLTYEVVNTWLSNIPVKEE